MSFTASTGPDAGTQRLRRPVRGGRGRRSLARPGAAAAGAGALAAAAVLSLAGPAGASARSAGGRASAVAPGTAAVGLRLRPMPAGTVTFGQRHGRLTVRAVMFGLTPGSAHRVDLVTAGRASIIRFSPLMASSGGSADSLLQSQFTGGPPRGSRLLIRMGAGGGRVARQPVAETGRLGGPGRGPHRLVAVETSPAGTSLGALRGRAALSDNARRHTLTVTVTASGLSPGPHAAHIHLGSCRSQGPVTYMLGDLVADRRGRIVHAVRVLTNVTTPVPARGWYLNIHQGNTSNILRNGQPTIFFRPLLCADIHGAGPVSAILRTGDVVTGVRGAAGGNVAPGPGRAAS